MAFTATLSRSNAGATYSAIVTVGMALIIGGALCFEHIGGYLPCHLCLIERNPYYFGIPLGIIAFAASVYSLPAWITRVLLVVIGVMMLVAPASAPITRRRMGLLGRPVELHQPGRPGNHKCR